MTRFANDRKPKGVPALRIAASGRSATVAARDLPGVSHRPSPACRQRQLPGIRTAATDQTSFARTPAIRATAFENDSLVISASTVAAMHSKVLS